jgi:hypothetical protein
MKRHIIGPLLVIGAVILALLNPLSGGMLAESDNGSTGALNLARPGHMADETGNKARTKKHHPGTDLGLEVANLKRELALVKTELASLKKSMAGRTLASAEADSGASGQPRPPTPEEVEAAADALRLREAEGVESMKRNSEYMASSFSSEPIETAWANATMASIRGAWEKNQTEGVNLIALECHTTQCRLEIEYAQTSIADDFESRLLNDLGGKLPSMMRHGGDPQDSEGAERVVLYLVREGFQWPSPESQQDPA